jgi:hypothetical protein
MTPIGLARKIAKLPERTPITHRFEGILSERGLWSPEREKKKYPSQKQHWLGWLSEYGSRGFYSRKNLAVRSAEVVYNRIGCPPMLLWLIEAARVPKRQVRLAMGAALSATSSYARQCAAIRKNVPWSIIEQQLRKQAGI